MRTFYRIDSTRVSFREYREYYRGLKTLFLPLGWMVRAMRVPVPFSSDDPNVATLAPFEIGEESLPLGIREQFRTLLEELRSLGFQSPIYHAIAVKFSGTTIYWATLYHTSGRACARIHYRYWSQPRPPRKYLFPVFITGFQDGGFCVSSAGKPDLAAPADWVVRYHRGASAADLWHEHERELDKEFMRSIPRVSGGYELHDFVERHHAALRDFHLERGVFVPFSETDLQTIAAATATAPEARPAPAAPALGPTHDLGQSAPAPALTQDFGQPAPVPEPELATDVGAGTTAQAAEVPMENADVLIELDRLQEKKTSWLGGLFVLGISLLVFAGAGKVQWSPDTLLFIVPVLLFHELGHLAAMRVFKYRNTRMFFIPLLGAAVTGRNYNVPGWKKAVVSLMGPLPGILLGGILGIGGWITGRPWLVELALFAVILNGFNLLPTLPLDGGWVLHATLFCRHRYLDITFRILAIFALIGIGLLSHDRLLGYVAIAMFLSLPTAYRTAKIADRLRNSGTPLPGPSEQKIPPALANEIVCEVKSSFPRSTSARNVAQVSLNVFETLNARPPGLLGSMFLLGVQGAAFLAAIVLALVFVFARQGNFARTLALAAQRPHIAYERGSTRTAPAEGPPVVPAGPRSTIVANCSDRNQAVTLFNETSGRLPPGARLTLFGQTLLLSLPQDQEKERNRLFDELQRSTTKIAVDRASHRVSTKLCCTAPGDAKARAIEDELNQFFTARMSAPDAIPPWSPSWQKAPNLEQWRKARKTLYRLGHESSEFYRSKEYKELAQKALRASARGDEATLAKIQEEQRQVIERHKAEYVAALKAEGPQKVDVALIDAYRAWQKASRPRRGKLVDDDELDDEPNNGVLPKELRERLGTMPESRELVKAQNAHLGLYGFLQREGPYLLLTTTMLEIERDLPVIAEWLYAKDCVGVTYDCQIRHLADEN